MKVLNYTQQVQGLSVVLGTISNSDSQLLCNGRRLQFGFYNGDIWLQEFGSVLLTKDPTHYHSIKNMTQNDGITQ